MVSKFRRLVLIPFGSTLVGFAALAGSAAAADSVPSANASAEADSDALEQVIVTATKRTEDVQRVPIVVSVVSSDDIANANIAQTSQLPQLAPSVTYVQGPLSIANVYSVRGIGSLTTNSGLEPSVGMVVDGVPLARVVGSILDLTDLNHVEVLNGPQGTLFGKNASAGVISLSSNNPVVGQESYSTRMSYGSFNNLQINGVSNLPIGDTVAARVAVFHNEHKGLVEDTVTGKSFGDLNTSGVRAKLLFAPSSDFDIMFTANLTNSHDAGAVTTIVRVNTANPAYQSSVTPLIVPYEAAHGVIIGTENSNTSTIEPSMNSQGSTQAYSVELHKAVGENTLTAVASWRKVFSYDDFEGSGMGGPVNLPDHQDLDVNNYHQLTAEVRLASADTGKFRYVAGLFTQEFNLHEDFVLDFALPIPTGPNTPPFFDAGTYSNAESSLGIKSRNYAGFGEGTYSFTDRLRLTAGARIAHDDISGSLDRKHHRTLVSSLPPFLVGPGAPFGPINLSLPTSGSNNLSGRTSLQYDLASGVMAYATVSSGYKAPGVSYGYTSTSGQIVNAETALSYEAGLKAEFLDQRLRLNLSAFDTSIKNFQASVALPALGAGSFEVRNAPELKTSGGAIELEARIARKLRISSSLSYTDARFADFPNAACYGSQTVAQGCIGGEQSLAGTPLPNAPKLKGLLAARYESDLTARSSWYVQANQSYQSKVVFQVANDPLSFQGGYGITDVRFGILSNDDHYDVSIFCNNAFAKYYLANIVPFANATYYGTNVVLDAYRSVGVALSLHY